MSWINLKYSTKIILNKGYTVFEFSNESFKQYQTLS